MPFQPGQPKTGGRKIGVVDRHIRALEIVETSGIDPLKVLMDLCKDGNKHVRLNAAKEVCKYIYPQFKNIEDAPATNPFSNLSDQEKLEKAKMAVQLLEERLKK